MFRTPIRDGQLQFMDVASGANRFRERRHDFRVTGQLDIDNATRQMGRRGAGTDRDSDGVR